MPLDVRQSTPDDLDGIAKLLIEAFNVSPDAYFVDKRLLAWKYFQSGPDWSGARSYVLCRGERIEAHCAVWPLRFQSPQREVSGVCFVDWASGKTLPGSGILLMKKLLASTEVGVVAGGSDATIAVIPKLGFTHVADIEVFARVVRPWKQFRDRPKEGFARDLARLGRNASWAFGSAPQATGWSGRPVDKFSAMPRSPSFPVFTPLHTAKYLNYWLDVPAAVASGFELVRDGVIAGYFLLLRAGHQTRIADLRISSSDVADWTAAYDVAFRTAAADSRTYEVVAVASVDPVRHALTRAGFRFRRKAPLFTHDPASVMGQPAEIWWSFIDDDTGYIFDAAAPYAT